MNSREKLAGALERVYSMTKQESGSIISSKTLLLYDHLVAVDCGNNQRLELVFLPLRAVFD